MVTSRLVDNKVGQVGQVGLSRVVPLREQGVGLGLYKSPVPPSLADLPALTPIMQSCPTFRPEGEP
jgi:hypothetical protein